MQKKLTMEEMNKNILESAFKLFLSWMLMLAIFVLLGGMIFGGLQGLNISNLSNWDGRHFLEIAQKGYGSKIQYAFFPLYPLLINLVNRVLNAGYLYSALIINLVALLGAIYIFLKLLINYGSKNPVKILIYFLIFPTSFYLISTYSESLFIFLALSTFFFAGRKKYLWASVFAALSLATRISGIAVILGLLVEIFLSKTKLSDKITVLFLSPLGFLLYCLFLYIQTGNPFYFLVSELSWDRNITIPGVNIWVATQYIVYYGIKPESFTVFSDLLFTVFGLGMVVRSIRYLKPSMFVYALISLLVPLTTALILSIPRFLIVIFPNFILIAEVKNRIFQIGYIIISLVILFLYFNLFLRNIWVS